MKSKNSIVVFLTVALVLGGVATLSSFANISVVFAAEIVANLSGQEEVPSVDTPAIGTVWFETNQPTNETIQFYINASNIQNATAGHLHSGVVGENGPIVVTLFNFTSAQNTVSEDGNITAINLEGPMQGKTVTDLVTAINSNSTYVNVHTVQNPNGEIRGQIIGMAMDNTTMAMDNTTMAMDNTTMAMDNTTMAMDNTTMAMDNTTVVIGEPKVAPPQIAASQGGDGGSDSGDGGSDSGDGGSDSGDGGSDSGDGGSDSGDGGSDNEN
jgi:uncharacterized membrane protein YgcG